MNQSAASMDNTQEFDSLETDTVSESDTAPETVPYYHERFHVLQLWLRAIPLIVTALLVVVAELFIVSTAQLQPVAMTVSVFMAIGLLALCWFGYAREKWRWQNWRLELDPAHNAVTLHRPGNRVLLIQEQSSVTIPMLDTSCTQIEQNPLEQYIFRRSWTVTIDNEIQGDKMFHSMKFVKDGRRVRGALIWYNNLHRRQAQAEIDVLTDIRQQLGTIIELLGGSPSAQDAP